MLKKYINFVSNYATIIALFCYPTKSTKARMFKSLRAFYIINTVTTVTICHKILLNL